MLKQKDRYKRKVVSQNSASICLLMWSLSHSISCKLALNTDNIKAEGQYHSFKII